MMKTMGKEKQGVECSQVKNDALNERWGCCGNVTGAMKRCLTAAKNGNHARMRHIDCEEGVSPSSAQGCAYSDFMMNRSIEWPLCHCRFHPSRMWWSRSRASIIGTTQMRLGGMRNNVMYTLVDPAIWRPPVLAWELHRSKRRVESNLFDRAAPHWEGRKIQWDGGIFTITDLFPYHRRSGWWPVCVCVCVCGVELFFGWFFLFWGRRRRRRRPDASYWLTSTLASNQCTHKTLSLNWRNLPSTFTPSTSIYPCTYSLYHWSDNKQRQVQFHQQRIRNVCHLNR